MDPPPSFAAACFLEDFAKACAFKGDCLRALEELLIGGECPVSSEEAGIQLVFLRDMVSFSMSPRDAGLAGLTGKTN